jgi:hypothetical protein
MESTEHLSVNDAPVCQQRPKSAESRGRFG